LWLMTRMSRTALRRVNPGLKIENRIKRWDLTIAVPFRSHRHSSLIRLPKVAPSSARIRSHDPRKNIHFLCVIQTATCNTIGTCDSQFKPGWMTDRGRGSQFWYENWAGLLRGLYAKGCVFWKPVTCGARSEASSASVSSNPVRQTWERTKNI